MGLTGSRVIQGYMGLAVGAGTARTTVPLHGKRDLRPGPGQHRTPNRCQAEVTQIDIRYPASLTQEADGGFLVQFFDLEEAFTEGDSLEEALFNAAEVLTLTLDARMDEGIQIPEPSVIADARLIAPSAKTQAALLVRRARADRPLADLARALDTSWPTAKRLEDPRHSPTLKQLERATAALGKRLVLSFE